MSDAARVHSSVIETAASGRTFPLWGAAALALLGAVAITAFRIQSVWTSGAFFDSDDAMRAVEVRDLLAGQSWFDMTAWRVDPPNGMTSHWSRIVDAPLAALEILFRLFLSVSAAERLTRLVFPLALLAGLLRLSAWNAAILGGRAEAFVAVWLTFLSGAMFVQFAPGRIDHHAPQIVLLMAALGFFLQGLEPDKARAMAFCAACMALSFAISLENAPFFVVMIGALPPLFIIDGPKIRCALRWFAVGALIAFPLCLAATVAPANYDASACDAFSAIHIAAIMTGALGLLGLCALASRLVTPLQRAAATMVAAAAVGAVILAIAPECVGDPLGGLDPLLREFWQSQVVESKPLIYFWAERPTLVVSIAAPVLLASSCALAFALTTEGAQRRRWLVIAFALVVGFAGGLWQVRVFTSVTPIATTVLAVAAVALSRRYPSAMLPARRAALAAVIGFAVSPTGIALALSAPEGETAQGADLSSLTPEALEPLATLAPGKIAAPVDMGAHLLAHTPHSVFAAPYHRNNHGNRIVIDAFLTEPAKAEALLRRAGADFVLWRQGGGTQTAIARRAPDGLGSLLARGVVPDWLEPLPSQSDKLLVFAIRQRK